MLADGEVFTVPKPGGSGTDCMRFINLRDSMDMLHFGYWLSHVLDPCWHWPFGLNRRLRGLWLLGDPLCGLGARLPSRLVHQRAVLGSCEGL